MSSEFLPATLQQAVPRLQEAARSGDPAAVQRIIDWGYQQIALEYQPDPILRPHHYALKWQAERAWAEQIRTLGKQMRTSTTQRAAEAWDYAEARKIEQQRWRDTEGRRQEAEQFNSDLRINEHVQVAGFNSSLRIQEMEAVARLAGQTQAGQAPDEDPLQLIRRINDEITRIEENPSLSYEQKHRATQTLRDSIPSLMQRALGTPRRG
ncbi:MAG: hypothetical protein M3R02_19550 [Chloroflexota bacterium]|nr:hypothetical protein [Chloroflexota bacterium]